jgi:fatty acid desaturase
LSVSILSLFLLPLALFLHYWFLGMIAIVSIIYILVWVHLAYVFMVNHVGMEIIDGTKVKEYSWLDLQTRTSRNILGWSIIHHVFGGLNKQIEHHLFPQASRYNIVAIAQITKTFCKEKNIKYHDVSFITSMKEIYNTLKTGKTL